MAEHREGLRRAALWGVLVAAVVLYGGLLRLDALVEKYGTVDHPAWARVLTHRLAPLGTVISPDGLRWPRVERPYVGGDPINYLKYGREFAGFYQPHVREPVFLALVRLALGALDDQDIAVSFASAAASTLAVFAVYLVGAALGSRLAGLVAAVLTSIEFDLVTWAPDGWRDDAFTAAVLFSIWALLRMRSEPTLRRGVIAGALCGLACLTRITALSFVVPGLLWVLIDASPAVRRERGRASGAAALMLVLVVAPYLISCWRATGDPFLSLNYHTLYYSAADQKPLEQPISAAAYIRGKFAEHPIRTIDTAFVGLFIQPFVTKWSGFNVWSPWLARIAKWMSLAGLIAMPLFPTGRLFLVLLTASLVPYMITWNVGGGDAWRFTMHAYPLYLCATGLVVAALARTPRVLEGGMPTPTRAQVAWIAWRGGAIAAAVAAGVLVYTRLPWYVVREAIAAGESTSIEAGARDAVFYRAGWSEPFRQDIVTRLTTARRSVVRFPLPEKRAYDLVLRMDPVTAATPDRVIVLFNGKWLSSFGLGLNPVRVGSYPLHVRADDVRPGSNDITIVPAATVPARAARPDLGWLDPEGQLAVRFWYLRVVD